MALMGHTETFPSIRGIRRLRLTFVGNRGHKGFPNQNLRQTSCESCCQFNWYDCKLILAICYWFFYNRKAYDYKKSKFYGLTLLFFFKVSLFEKIRCQIHICEHGRAFGPFLKQIIKRAEVFVPWSHNLPASAHIYLHKTLSRNHNTPTLKLKSSHTC